MSGTINGLSEVNSKMITEIVEKNKQEACFELFDRPLRRQVGTIQRTFLYKGRRFLVTLKDVTDE